MNFKKHALVAALVLLPLTAHAAPYLQTHGNYAHTQSLKANSWLEIDVKAFEDNLVRLKQEVGTSKICAVMKADAYGNGIDLLMPSVIKLQVPCIAIASNEEARVARAHGYQGAIVRVRMASLDEVRDGLGYAIEELVGSASYARAISTIAENANQTVRVHLALNSGGMDRNGLELAAAQGQADALAITRLPALQIVGIMTHYAFEDEAYVKERLARFNQESAWLIKAAGLDRNRLTLHTANSFATGKVPESRLDMVRPGGLLYGDMAGFPDYKKTMRFVSKVASVQFYKKGTTVGYDGTYTLNRDSYLANLPFGYSDGYRRVFTNKGHVLIHGERAPVVGKVSMNTTMVDVTDLILTKGIAVASGDEVVVYGVQGKNEITQDEIEDINGALLADLYTVWGNSNIRLVKP